MTRVLAETSARPSPVAAHQIVESGKLPAQGRSLGSKDLQLSVPGDSGRHFSFSDEQASYEPDPEVCSEDLRSKQEHLKSGQGQRAGFEVSLPFFLGGLLQHLDAKNQRCARWPARPRKLHMGGRISEKSSSNQRRDAKPGKGGEAT